LHIVIALLLCSRQNIIQFHPVIPDAKANEPCHMECHLDICHLREKKMPPSFDELFPYGTADLSRSNQPNVWDHDPDTVAVEGVGTVAVASTVCTKDGQCPHYHRAEYVEEEVSTATIHFLIASYRDGQCSRTLHYIFHRATYPERIYVRILDQTEPESGLVDDAGCFARFCSDFLSNATISQHHNLTCEQYKKHIRTVHMLASQAKGVPDARSKLAAMVHWDYIHRDQVGKLDFHPVNIHDFCFQIDSHSDFYDGYDVMFIRMFHRTKNDYAVLSTYPDDVDTRSEPNRTNVANLCMVDFPNPPIQGSIRIWHTQSCNKLKVPKLSNALHGGGLSFHRCHAELNVPDDPYMDHIYNGNEASRGIRFFSHGYDIYAPDKNLVYHDYKRDGKMKLARGYFFNYNASDIGVDQLQFMQDILHERHKLNVVGLKRVDLLLGIGPYNYTATEYDRINRRAMHQSRFGWGPKRTPEQAIEFTGINFFEKRMDKNKCGNLVWVPYEESPNYGVDDTLNRSLAGMERGRIGEEQREPPFPVVSAAYLNTSVHALSSSSSSRFFIETPIEIPSMEPMPCLPLVPDPYWSTLIVACAAFIYILYQRFTNKVIYRRQNAP
jgi:hypothetical protein